MRMHAEDEPAGLEMVGSFPHDADAAVSVPEREVERSLKGTDRFVQHDVGIDPSSERERLGAGADAGERRLDHDVAGTRIGDVDLDDADLPGSFELDGFGLHGADVTFLQAAEPMLPV
jgi:hypothetical protein